MKPILASKSLMKELNCATIIHLIKESNTISRAELAKRSGLSPATVSTITAELENLGLVKEIGEGLSNGGRKPTLYQLSTHTYVVIGIEFSPSAIYIASIGIQGEIARKTNLDLSGSESHEELETILYNLVDHHIKQEQHKILGIGLGMHGLVNSESGVSIFAPAFQWSQQPWRQKLVDRYKYPVWIDNDVRVMARSEKWFGQAQKLNNFVFLNVGRGIGSALVVNGHLLTGEHFGSGEIGHIYVGENGRTCYCGKQGCLSTYASGKAIEEDAYEHYQRPITGNEVYELANDGDQVAAQLLRKAGLFVGQALAVLINLIDPAMIFIGGGVSQALPWFEEGLESGIQNKTMTTISGTMKWGPSMYGIDAGVVGAAAMVYEQVFANPIQFFSQKWKVEGQ